MADLSKSSPIPEHDEWYLALGFKERLQSDQFPLPPVDSAQRSIGEQRLNRWLINPAFENRSPRFVDRLATEGLDEDSFLALLSESRTELAKRRPSIPENLMRAIHCVEEYVGIALETECWLSAVELDRFPAACLRLAGPFLDAPLATLRQEVEELFRYRAGLCIDSNLLCQLLIRPLADRVNRMFLRTLALEVNLARITGKLHAATSEERFDEFMANLCQIDRIKLFYREYPVLARQMVTTIDHWQHAAIEFIKRLVEDWPRIQQLFFSNAPPGVLTDLDLGAGDSHRQGRSVIKLTFSSGLRLIYKPRPLALDVHFNQMLTWLNEKLDNNYKDFPLFHGIKVIDCGEYGWCEFVHGCECDSLEAVERFYLRQGGYLALLYLLDATDFHSENLIADGEYPMLVDLEACFHPRVEDLFEIHADPAMRVWANSVMRTGLLPQRVDGSHDGKPGYDNSGLGARLGQIVSKPISIMMQIGTDEMHVESVTGATPVTNSNAPMLMGRRLEPMPYLAQVCNGFETIYRVIMKYRDEFLSGPLPTFRQDSIRVILVATNDYDRILRASFHPDFLRDALDRQRVIDRLWWITIDRSENRLDQLLGSEFRDLLNHDIPFFSTSTDSRDIVDSYGRRFPNILPESGYSAVLQRIQELDEADLNQQLWFIRGSFATIPLGMGEKSWRPSELRASVQPLTRDRLFNHAVRVGERLIELAVHDRRGTGWIGLELTGAESEWKIVPTGISLYDGSAGIALFLAYLGEFTSDARYRDTVRTSLNIILSQANRVIEEKKAQSVGAFGDIGGAIYLMAHLGSLWNDQTLLDKAEELVLRSQPHIEAETELELLMGLGGFIAVLLCLHHVRPSNKVLDIALRCGDRIARGIQRSPDFPSARWPSRIEAEAPLTGLSHGAAGIALAMLRLSIYSEAPTYREVADWLLDYERSVYSEESGNWPDFRICQKADSTTNSGSESAKTTPCFTTWCHGAPGIGLSRLSMLNIKNDPLFEKEIAAAIQTTLKNGFGLNHSLCHGDLGNLELLLTAGDRVDQDEFNRIGAMIVDSIERIGWSTGIPLGIESPGLMTGIAGIGYGLLRLMEPEKVPSVLTLEPPFIKLRKLWPS